MNDLATLQGILALVDVVNFTPQANQLGEKYTAQYTAYFQEKIKTIVTKYRFQVVKYLGDAVLVFGTSPQGLLEIMLDLYERDKPEDKYGFKSRFRLVAHSGFFQFKMKEQQPVDLVSPEGIKVFRMEKEAAANEMVVTRELYQGLMPLLTLRSIQAQRLALKKSLKGFDGEDWVPTFFKLKITRVEFGAANLLERRQSELEQEVQFILVFGGIYDPVPMEKNFINLSLKYQPAQDRDMGGSQPTVPGNGDNKKSRRGLQEKKDEWLDHEWDREFVDEAREIDVPTLYENKGNRFTNGVIFGLPGAGKTTILHYLAFKEFNANKTRDRQEGQEKIILLLSCRGIPFYDDWFKDQYGEGMVETDENKALEYMTWVFLLGSKIGIAVSPEERVEYRHAVNKVKQAFKENRLTLLVDALDEAPDIKYKENIMRLFLLLAVESQHKDGNRLFLTSRPSERLHLYQKGIPVFYLLSLTMEQVRAMARQLMKENSEIYQKFDQAIWQEEMVVKMAATPLTALLVTAYFQAYEKFHHRFPMYDFLMKFTLLRIWESIKTNPFSYKKLALFFAQIKKPDFLEKKREIRILYDALASLCFDLFYDAQDGKIQRDVGEELLMLHFNQFIREHLYYEKEGDPVIQPALWIERFHQDHLLLKAGNTRYVFVHSMVMEFLAAYNLVNRIIKKCGELVPLVRKCVRSKDHLELETLPIAAGSDLMWGFAILSTLRDLEVPYKPEYLPYEPEYLHEVAVKCLAELEWQILKTLQAIPLENLIKQTLDLIQQNQNAVDWLYQYLKEMVLTSDKDRIRKSMRRFAAMLKLRRDTFLKEYLSYEDFDKGDSELVGLRKEMLFQLVQKELVEQWLRSHQEKAARGKLWQLDTPIFHPEDKNFRYFQAMIGQELQGFLGTPNMRHSGVVRACAFAPDGKTFVSASDDGTLKLWDAASGKEIRTFTGHTAPVSSCSFSPDGYQLVSASTDKTLKLWEVATGKEIRTFTGHTDEVLSGTFSPDGSQMASASADQTIKLWEIASGQEIRTFTGHTDSVLSCTFSPDGYLLVSASDDRTSKLWEVSSGKEIFTFNGHHLEVLCCVFSPDGYHLVSVSKDKTLKLWEVTSGKEIRTFTGHTDAVLSCAFSPSGTRLVSASSDRTLKLWEVTSGKEIRTFTGHTDAVLRLAFSPGRSHFVSASADKKLKLWEVASGKEICSFTGHKDSIWCCAFSPDDNHLISASRDKTVKLWEIASGKEIRAFTGHTDTVWGCAFSPDGTYLVSASADRTLKLWEVKSGKEIHTFTGHQGTVEGCAFYPSGNHLISTSKDKTLKLWEVKSGAMLKSIQLPWIPQYVAISKDNRVITANENGTLTLFKFAEL